MTAASAGAHDATDCAGAGAGALPPERAPAAREPPIPSSALLRGRCCLEISHNGMVYRLTVTRLGKLILTK
jgi:hemin uptake protein HemP